MKFEIFYDMTPNEVVGEIDYVLADIGYTIEMKGDTAGDSIKFEIVRL